MKKNRRPFGKILMILAIAFFYLPILYILSVLYYAFMTSERPSMMARAVRGLFME